MKTSVFAPDLKDLFKKPTRITITINWKTFQELQARSEEEGRSLSNLAAYLLEKGTHS